MKYFPLVFIALGSPAALATEMAGFGASYYQNDQFISCYDTDKNLVPEIIVGANVFVMELSRLADIAITAGVTVNQDDQASWLCLASEGVNYWFISDNEMGRGNLTSVAVARAARQKGCSFYNGDLNVKVKGIPLLHANLKNLSSTFSNQPEGKIIQYCADSNIYGNFTQMNCLQYYIENKSAKGIIISQVTSN